MLNRLAGLLARPPRWPNPLKRRGEFGRCINGLDQRNATRLMQRLAIADPAVCQVVLGFKVAPNARKIPIFFDCDDRNDRQTCVE